MTNDRNWTVYFEIGGKKMKMKVIADSYYDAIKVMKDKIKIHKVDLEPEDESSKSSDVFNSLMDIFNMK